MGESTRDSCYILRSIAPPGKRDVSVWRATDGSTGPRSDDILADRLHLDVLSSRGLVSRWFAEIPYGIGARVVRVDLAGAGTRVGEQAESSPHSAVIGGVVSRKLC